MSFALMVYLSADTHQSFRMCTKIVTVDSEGYKGSPSKIQVSWVL